MDGIVDSVVGMAFKGDACSSRGGRGSSTSELRQLWERQLPVRKAPFPRAQSGEPPCRNFKVSFPSSPLGAKSHRRHPTCSKAHASIRGLKNIDGGFRRAAREARAHLVRRRQDAALQAARTARVAASFTLRQTTTNPDLERATTASQGGDDEGGREQGGRRVERAASQSPLHRRRVGY